MTITLFTVNGTASNGPYDPNQYPVQVAEALTAVNPWASVADKWDGLATPPPKFAWQAVDYPAATVLMGASVKVGVAQLVSQIEATPGPFVPLGYSQGAIAAATVWRDYILNPAGPLHNRLADCVSVITWGDPLRCPGIANGNTFAGWPIPAGGGISGTNDLTAAQTPSTYLAFANPNDLYTDSPVGTPAGMDEQMVYNLIVTSDFGGTLEGLLVLIESVIKQFSQPLIEVIGVATAIWNGLQFVSAGQGAGHYTYSVDPAIQYLTQVIAPQFA